MLHPPASNPNQTDICADPANGGQIKLWTCYPGLLQQTWTYNSGTKAWSIANSERFVVPTWIR